MPLFMTLIDRQTLAIFIPILVLSIPIVAIVFGGLARIAKIKAEGQGKLGSEALDRIADLENQVQLLQQQLTETQERLDFTERVLAKPPDRV